MGKGWYTQIDVCSCLGKLRHPSTLAGMGWYGMVWDGMVT